MPSADCSGEPRSRWPSSEAQHDTATPASASSDCCVTIGWDGGYFYFCLLCVDDDSCEYECTTGHSGKC